MSDSQLLTLGSEIALGGEKYRLVQFLDMQSVVGECLRTHEKKRLLIKDWMDELERDDIDASGETIAASAVDLLSPEDWQVANSRLKALEPLLVDDSATKAAAQEIANRLGVHVATLYRWLSAYKKTGDLKALAPHHPTGGRGKGRIDAIAESVIRETIEERWYSLKRLGVDAILEDVRARCRRASVRIPHENTVRRRIKELSSERASERGGRALRHKQQPNRGVFPGGSFPNEIWQIDHTPLDVCIVDDVYRRNIGRPWLTLVIDIYSRCVPGYYLSLDKPNAASAGMALVHAMLPKEGWLSAHGLSAAWPMRGKPRTVHADNDKTFRGDMLTRAAAATRINLEWRPVRTPHWGGHIERILGVTNKEIQRLDGTTFSNPQARGDYKPHEEANLTFAELERYLAEWICGVYHQRPHRGLGMRPPIRAYELGFLGDGVRPPMGLPAPIKDPQRLKIEFLPVTEKTIQKYGVVWDRISYYDPAIDRYIRDGAVAKRRRKFICRRDPRDISFIWLLDPELDRYLKIPYRNIEYPSINLWELREVRKILEKEGKSEADENLIFDTYARLRDIEKTAKAATQEVRRSRQRRATYGTKLDAEAAQLGGPRLVEQKPERVSDDDWDDNERIAPFGT